MSGFGPNGKNGQETGQSFFAIFTNNIIAYKTILLFQYTDSHFRTFLFPFLVPFHFLSAHLRDSHRLHDVPQTANRLRSFSHGLQKVCA